MGHHCRRRAVEEGQGGAIVRFVQGEDATRFLSMLAPDLVAVEGQP